MSNKPVTYNATAIGDVFENVVKEIREAFESDARGAAELKQPRTLMNAVDVELSFKSVQLSEKGFVLFGKDTKESQMEIRLATRITPPS